MYNFNSDFLGRAHTHSTGQGGLARQLETDFVGLGKIVSPVDLLSSFFSVTFGDPAACVWMVVLWDI